MDENVNKPPAVALPKYLNEQQAKDIEQFNIIQSFALNLAENTKDLDPEFSKVVDDHFWDLV
jgi:phosphoribosylformylglycinamidine (FGAM) synthase PurS component